jgi:protein-arginine kinase activator protein McsA
MTYTDIQAEMARVRALGLICDQCGENDAEVECEDITGYSRFPCDYLCARCYDKRCDYGDDGREWPQARNE